MEYYGNDWSRCVIGALDRDGVRKFYDLSRKNSGLPISDVAPRPVLEPEAPVPQRSSW